MRAEIREFDASLDDRLNEFRKEILAAYQQTIARLRRPGR
jgi:hypothetical protein